MNETTQASRDRLVADLKAVLSDSEELLKLTAGEAGERVAEVRGRLSERVSGLKGRLADVEAAVTERTREVARATDDYVHEHPWRSVGAAAGVSFLLGLLVGRR